MQESEYSPQNGRSPCHFPRGPHTKLPILKESNGHRAGVNIDCILSETGAESRMSLSPYCAIDNRCNPLRYACCAMENSCRAVGAKNVTYSFLHIIGIITPREGRCKDVARRRSLAARLGSEEKREKLDKKEALPSIKRIT